MIFFASFQKLDRKIGKSVVVIFYKHILVLAKILFQYFSSVSQPPTLKTTNVFGNHSVNLEHGIKILTGRKSQTSYWYPKISISNSNSCKNLACFFRQDVNRHDSTNKTSLQNWTKYSSVVFLGPESTQLNPENALIIFRSIYNLQKNYSFSTVYSGVKFLFFIWPKLPTLFIQKKWQQYG